jgi:hypothetical protein
MHSLASSRGFALLFAKSHPASMGMDRIIGHGGDDAFDVQTGQGMVILA